MKESDRQFEIRLLFLVALLAFIFVGSFAVYRFIEGNIKVAVADTLIVLTAAGAAFWARRTGNTFFPGLIVSILLSAGAVFVAFSLGFNGLLWFFPLITFMVHLVPPFLALVMSVIVIFIPLVKELKAPLSMFSSQTQLFSYLMTAITVMVFSVIFADRIRRHRKQLFDLASQDALTGLNNRRSLEQELQIAISKKKRYSIDYGLIIFDVDNFKDINDNHGHDQGDHLLREIAYQIRESVRLSDRAFRYGGDEFVIILPNTGFKGINAVCKKLLLRISSATNSVEGKVTISLGGAKLRENESAEGWFRRADRCLLQAKQQGKNCYIVE